MPEPAANAADGAGASTSTSSVPSSGAKPSNSYSIVHMPRKKAAPPAMVPDEVKAKGEEHLDGKAQLALTQTKLQALLTEDQAAYATFVRDQNRLGPWFVKYCFAGGFVGIVYTYLHGFYALSVRDHTTWRNTFKHRLLVLGPLITMYCTANNIVPMPLKDQLEQWLGRPALSMVDVQTSRNYFKILSDAEQRGYVKPSL